MTRLGTFAQSGLPPIHVYVDDELELAIFEIRKKVVRLFEYLCEWIGGKLYGVPSTKIFNYRRLGKPTIAPVTVISTPICWLFPVICEESCL